MHEFNQKQMNSIAPGRNISAREQVCWNYGRKTSSFACEFFFNLFLEEQTYAL